MEPANSGVLEGLAPYLRVLKVYSPDTYRCAPNFLARRICLLLGVLTLAASVFVFSFLIFWEWTERHHMMLLQLICVQLACFQVVWTHLFCVQNGDGMIQAIGYLKNVITCRVHSKERSFGLNGNVIGT